MKKNVITDKMGQNGIVQKEIISVLSNFKGQKFYVNAKSSGTSHLRHSGFGEKKPMGHKMNPSYRNCDKMIPTELERFKLSG